MSDYPFTLRRPAARPPVVGRSFFIISEFGGDSETKVAETDAEALLQVGKRFARSRHFSFDFLKEQNPSRKRRLETCLPPRFCDFGELPSGLSLRVEDSRAVPHLWLNLLCVSASLR